MTHSHIFKHAHVDLPGRVFLQWYSLDTSSVRWSVGIGCSPPFYWTFDALDRAGLNIRPPNNIQPQNDPRSARNDTIEKKKKCQTCGSGNLLKQTYNTSLICQGVQIFGRVLHLLSVVLVNLLAKLDYPFVGDISLPILTKFRL